MDRSADIQKKCGMVWIDKDHFIEHNLQVLVENKLLTTDEAARVRTSDVRVGDPECMVYATYSLWQARADFARDAKGRLSSIRFHYRCDRSPVSCPGKSILVADGRVADLSGL